MNYAEMSDFEINKAVAIIEGHKCYYDNGTYTNGLDANRAVVKGNGIIGGFNPCYSWADAGPIIFNYGISIMKDSGLHLWCATSSAYWADGSEWQMREEVMDTNPLRAAMIVFLMMQEEKDNEKLKV